MVGNSIFVTRDFYVTVDIFVKSKSLLIDRTVFKIRKRSDDSIFFETENNRNAIVLCMKLQRIADISEGNNEI